MKQDLLIKVKKALKVLFLVVSAIILLLIASTIYFISRSRTVQPVVEHVYSTSGITMSIPAGIRGGYINARQFNADKSVSVEDMAIPVENDSILVDKKITQSGYLSIAVDRVEDGITAITKIAGGVGGNVDSVQFSNISVRNEKKASVVIRVPAVNFDQAMEQVKAIAINVSSQNISTNDVTDQFIDMQAQLKNLKAVELQYQSLLQKAQSIDDIMMVTDELSYIRQQIDQLQGQMNYLSREVDMSIISVNLTSSADLGNTIWNPGATANEAMQGFLQGFYGFLDVIIFTILFLIPIMAIWLILLGLLLWLCWAIVKGVYKKLHS